MEKLSSCNRGAQTTACSKPLSVQGYQDVLLILDINNVGV